MLQLDMNRKAKAGYRSAMGVAAGCAALFAVLTAGVVNGWWDSSDQKAANAFHDMHRDFWTPLFKGFSELGSTTAFAVLFVVAAAGLLLRRRFREAAVLLASTGGAYVLNSVLKHAVARDRPSLPHLIEADGYGFPSGNAMVGTAFYGMLLLLVLRSSWPVRRWIAGILVLVLFLIGFGRLYLNVHYPTDILAGYAGGAAWASVCSFLLSRRIR